MEEMLNQIETTIGRLDVETVPPGEIKDLLTGVLTGVRDHLKTQEEREVAARFEQVRRAVGALSYSEDEALVAIMDEVEDDGGLIVTSQVADRKGITRSVVVNAMRKFESAGIIRSTSLGMKGTRIKPLIPGWKHLVTEARKLRTLA